MVLETGEVCLVWHKWCIGNRSTTECSFTTLAMAERCIPTWEQSWEVFFNTLHSCMVNVIVGTAM